MPGTGIKWRITTSGPNQTTVLARYTPDGKPYFPSETATLYDLPEHIADRILQANERFITYQGKEEESNSGFVKIPRGATKEWVLDQILAKEAKGIDCGIERQMAKHYFSEPQFTPKRALSPTEAAKPQDPWDVPF
jgi:hypothetical protein